MSASSSQTTQPEAGWNVESSIVAKRTSNPIRKIVDQMNVKPNPAKELVSLSIGDPTIYGNLPPPETATLELSTKAREGKSNGYLHSCGASVTRDAVARSYSTSARTYTADDIVLASGCSGAIEMAIGVLGNEGDNILIPRPGFSLYQTICESKGIECRYYPLLPDKMWEADLESMLSMIDSRTKAIIINNPSNPCGSVFTLEHLRDITKLASTKRIPIIADEIYANMTFSGVPFHSAVEAGDHVPILVTSGLAKRFMVPGWRLGWILIHDPVGAFAEVRKGLVALSTLILGPNSVVQAATQSILDDTPPSYIERTMGILEENAKLCVKRINTIPELHVIEPRGAMYMMVGIKQGAIEASLTDDVQFSRTLLIEQAVSVLPGSCFGFKQYFRIVLCPPPDKLESALQRIAEFCEKHSLIRGDNSKNGNTSTDNKGTTTTTTNNNNNKDKDNNTTNQ